MLDDLVLLSVGQPSRRRTLVMGDRVGLRRAWIVQVVPTGLGDTHQVQRLVQRESVGGQLGNSLDLVPAGGARDYSLAALFPDTSCRKRAVAFPMASNDLCLSSMSLRARSNSASRRRLSARNRANSADSFLGVILGSLPAPPVPSRPASRLDCHLRTCHNDTPRRRRTSCFPPCGASSYSAIISRRSATDHDFKPDIVRTPPENQLVHKQTDTEGKH